MNKENKLKVLFKDIYGGEFNSLSQVDLIERGRRNINDKCSNCGDKCISFSKKQDIPYFKSLKNIKTLVIAESPGSGEDTGKYGFVFGWEQFENNPSKVIKNYKNYFFNFLNLNPEEVYITDAIKCYTHKNFSSAFENCHQYLLREIQILKPEKILVVSKQDALINYLSEIKDTYNFTLIVVPHPSTQNMSKIPTVSEIFIANGQLTNNKKWIDLGNQIQEEYKFLGEKLNE